MAKLEAEEIENKKLKLELKEQNGKLNKVTLKLEFEKNENNNLTMNLENATNEIMKANRGKKENEQEILTLKMIIEDAKKEMANLKERNEKIVVDNWQKCSDYNKNECRNK